MHVDQMTIDLQLLDELEHPIHDMEGLPEIDAFRRLLDVLYATRNKPSEYAVTVTKALRSVLGIHRDELYRMIERSPFQSTDEYNDGSVPIMSFELLCKLGILTPVTAFHDPRFHGVTPQAYHLMKCIMQLEKHDYLPV
jgi:hypothetical protein